MTNKATHLPIFGVGPFYVCFCLLATLAGLLIQHQGYLLAGEVKNCQIIFNIAAILSIFLGLWLYIQAVMGQKILQQIKQGQLVTSGVYALVRNPIYSAFLFVFTGILLLAQNYLLLILPLIFYLVLTILLKFSEEKWLEKKFGHNYLQYCQKVNRIIPFFPRNKLRVKE